MAARIIVAVQNGKPVACKNLVLSDQVSKIQIAEHAEQAEQAEREAWEMSKHTGN